MATSKDVARRAGVSVATISRVYQYPERVKPETRELVLKAARELDYSQPSGQKPEAKQEQLHRHCCKRFHKPFLFSGNRTNT